VVSAAQEKRLPLSLRKRVSRHLRAGREGLVAGNESCGNGKLLREQGIEIPADERTDVQHSSSAATPVYVAVDMPCGRHNFAVGQNQSVTPEAIRALRADDAYCSAYWRSPRRGG